MIKVKKWYVLIYWVLFKIITLSDNSSVSYVQSKISTHGASYVDLADNKEKHEHISLIFWSLLIKVFVNRVLEKNTWTIFTKTQNPAWATGIAPKAGLALPPAKGEQVWKGPMIKSRPRLWYFLFDSSPLAINAYQWKYMINDLSV